jgi:hypothetical protein
MTDTPALRRSWTDRVLERLFRLKPEHERAFEDQRRNLHNRDHFLHDMSVIDAKSSALLTHVSIMLAVIAFLLGSPGHDGWKWILTGELAAFSAVGVLLLRCVDIIGPPFRRIPPQSQLEDYYRAETQLRRALFQAMVRTVRLLTVSLIAIVVAEKLA